MVVTAKKKAAAKKRSVGTGQREAMAEGRRQAQIVRSYLEALRTASAPKKRGRKRTPESIQTRLRAIQAELADPNVDVLRELKLAQEHKDLTAELDGLQAQAVDPAMFEGDFVKVAKSYGERQGISPDTWRQMGVSRSVLKRAKVVD